MDLALISLEKIAEMFLILVMGIVLYRCGLITSDMNRRMSNLLLMFVAPFLVFSSYQMEFTSELLYGWLQTFILTILSFILTIFMTRVIIRKRPGYDRDLERICIIYSNCGYIGLPLLNALFGQQGVFYMTVYMTVFNILVWTQGVMLISGKKDFRQALRNLLSPMVIGVLLGVICFFGRIHLPDILLNPMRSIGEMNTPLAMLVAGASLAETDIKKMLKKYSIYWISLVKLVFCPLLFFICAVWFRASELPFMTVFLGAACPVGTTGTLFALRYGRDNAYATELLAVSTVFSIFSIPLMILVKNFLQGIL
ncbi:AEC family transporter [Hominifimenecus sp. rT4P-3]|uniref:AEC family transporter n=1 Tax=Hominifimenecus sp. rT4P-3 TaxID=3242979 RepID=UPI003DA4D62F